METVTLITVTTSNIFSLIPIYSLWNKSRYMGVIFTSCAAIASILMHATETKHNLPGLFWAKYSNTFLNLDRIFAVNLMAYGLWLFYNHPNKNWWQVITIFCGLFSLKAGELTMNLPLYTLTHCMWHFLAFYSLHLVNY